MIFTEQVILEVIISFFSRVTNIRPLTNKQQVVLWVKLCYKLQERETRVTELPICAKDCARCFHILILFTPHDIYNFIYSS